MSCTGEGLAKAHSLIAVYPLIPAPQQGKVVHVAKFGSKISKRDRRWLTRGIDEMFKIWYYDCDQELMDCIDTENEFVQVGEMDTLRFK